MVQWLHALNADGAFSSQAIDHAASAGHLEIVQFLLANRGEGFSCEAVNKAKMNGHACIVALLHRIEHVREQFTRGLAHAIGVSGRVDVLEWDCIQPLDPSLLRTVMHDIMGTWL